MPQIIFFPYFGPNRHSDRRVLECRMDFGHEQAGEFPQRSTDITDVLLSNGMIKSADSFFTTRAGEDRMQWYASLFVQTVLWFQRINGHEVDYYSVSCEPSRKRSIALVEHEDAETAQAAVRLAVEVFSGKPGNLKPAFEQFSKFARSRALSAETKSIIRQAQKRAIPCLQLDRLPLTGCIKTGFRVRPNGLLSLGYGARSQILDGTFCYTRTGQRLSPLLQDPARRLALLRQTGLTVVRHDPHDRQTHPVLRVLMVNRQLTAIFRTAKGVEKSQDNVHASIIGQVQKLAEAIAYAPFMISFRVADATASLKTTEGVVGLDLAPDLGRFFNAENNGNVMLDKAAGDLLDWLYPNASSARIPLVAITGTNGKTTTSRMVRHIFNHRGYQTGLVCTDGIFLGQQQVADEDNSTFQGHARVLTSKLIDAAVLETHHRGIAVHGFAFRQCDIGVCLNVTEEHLAKGEIETVEEMTEIKRALVERASGVAVLFADDPNCVAMIDHLNSERLCLVSLQKSTPELAKLAADRPAGFCVLEVIDDRLWMVMYDGEKRIPVMPVIEVPATYNATAMFNVSNAMHAVAASYYAGISTSVIRSAMTSFKSDQQHSPGRMNQFDDLPFKVIMDFAHNPDGMKKFCEFSDLQQVDGRKIIAFAGLAKRPDELNRKIATIVAGHFDFYYCKDYQPEVLPKKRFVGPFMQEVLLEKGIPEDATQVLTFGKEAIFEILDGCRPGDMLMLLAGHVESKTIPGYINEYRELLNKRKGS